jgi:hypothetical protein
MLRRKLRSRWWLLPALLALGLGCQQLSDRLTKWDMLGQDAPENPLQAVGGDGILFTPEPAQADPMQLASARPEELVRYYAPVFVQQRVDSAGQRYPYPPEYDRIGTAGLRHESDGSLKAVVSGEPKVYAIYQKRHIGNVDHVQLTYTAWYPAHPRMKAIDLEEADVDSCVVRVTLDVNNVPLFYETIAACGCFHKVFVPRWLEEAAGAAYGPPEQGKKFAVEKTVRDAIDWEVAGVVDEKRDRPGRPVVFIKAGDHKVLGIGASGRLRVPPRAEVRPYEVRDYAELYAVRVDGGSEVAPFFDPDKGGKVRGAERKERLVFSLLGVDAAGQPRANDQIKLHFDQSTWDDTTIYARFLRLPHGTL